MDRIEGNPLRQRPARLALASAIAAVTIAGCDVDQTRQAELPDVDVSVEEGQMPGYDVEWADVDVGTTEETVEVPKVVIVQETETLEVPYIDIDMPDEGPSEERTVAVELELTQMNGDIDIESVYADQRRLTVVSRFEREDQALGEERVRVSDQMQLNAPDSLDVRHIVVGERPEGDWNNQYRFVNSMDRARSLIGREARELYSR